MMCTRLIIFLCAVEAMCLLPIIQQQVAPQPIVLQRHDVATMESMDAVIQQKSRIESVRKACIAWNANDAFSAENHACSICLEEFCTDDVLLTLPCFHIFHQNCIETWFARSPALRCPECDIDVVQSFK